MKRLIPILIFVSLFIHLSFSIHAKTITVGVYDNYPKVFIDNNGKSAGIFIDILNYIAKAENWEIVYKAYSWQEGLKALENGEIDLMPDVNNIHETSKKIQLTQIDLLSSWLQIYRRSDVMMESIMDLNNKKIAVLQGSAQETKIQELIVQLKLNCQVVTYADYSSAEESLINGDTDGMIASRFYEFAISSSKSKRIIPSHLIFSPSTLHYATTLHKNEDIIRTIDYHLSVIKNQHPSIYHQVLYKWLGSKAQVIIPNYLFIIIVSSLILLFIALVLILVLLVKIKAKSKQLENALNQLKLTQHEIMKNERLHLLGQVAAGIAHDLNNILTPILAYTESMLSFPSLFCDKEKITDTLLKIKTAVHDGVTIINRIKMFYKSKQMEEPISTIDTQQMITETLDFIEPVFKNMFIKKNVSVKIECDLSAISPIQMRRSDFRETIINLVINAAEAIPENGVIKIASREDLDNKMVIVSISDNGTGMSSEIQKHCFDPFYSTKGDTGTGLGLSMIADIIKSYQGTIKLDSTVGQGSTFSIGLRCL